MTFPNFAGKHDLDPIITPAQAVEYIRARGSLGRDRGVADVPEAVVLLYSKRLEADVLARHPHDTVAAPVRTLHVLRDVGIRGDFGIGAPAAAVVLEELAACGVRRFASVGAAGAIQSDAREGDVYLCTSAIRDEGVSHHYLPSGLTVDPSPKLTERVAECLPQPFTRGGTWTIDAPFRETVAEVRHYQQAGVLTVEMEAAALFAIAQVRGVEICAAFVASDMLGELTWQPKFADPIVHERLHSVIDAAIDALT